MTWRTVAKRQLFFLLVVSTAVSLGATGRVTPRLMLDAGVSALFMPVFQVLAFLAIWRARYQSRPGAIATDAAEYVALNTPWLWWWCAMACVVAFVAPRALGPWIFPMILSLPIFFLWGVVVDYRWLVRSRQRSPRAAVIDIAALRLATWVPAVVWFLGIAIWYDTLPGVIERWRP